MSDITISVDEIDAVLKQRLAGFTPTLAANQVGEGGNVAVGDEG